MTAAVSLSSRQQTLDALVARFGQGNDGQGNVVTAAMLRQGKPLLADVELEDESLSLRCDALMRVDDASNVAGHSYVPVLNAEGDKVGGRQMVLAVFGLTLSRVQGLRPEYGLVAHG